MSQVGYGQRQASQIFTTVGVSIDWHVSRSCRSMPDAVEMTFQAETQQELLPGALAYACPYGKSHIVILYDRVAASAATHDVVANRLLAFVILHEVTHVLQAIARHSDSGIMMAKWTAAEYFRMREASLGFTDDDVDFIHAKRNSARVAQLLASTGVGLKAAGLAPR